MKLNRKLIVAVAAIAVMATAIAFSVGYVVPYQGAAAVPTYKGGIPDVIQYTVQTNRELGLKDVLEGNTDIFLEGVSGADYRAFSDGKSAAELDKIEEYVTPTISWSYLLNPVPNKAPYTWKNAKGEVVFNPFAVKEIRFAFNWLFSRKKIVDEILKGDGFPQFTAMTPGQPGSYRFNLVAAKLGFQDRGDEKRAIAEIDAAMNAAANLPENKGKLAKSGAFWQYDGKPVTIRFYIRIDDPTGRLLAGRYVADQIEKAGIKVERIEVDRRKCSAAVYGGNPADLEWQIYTEGWGAGGTRKFWDITVSQMYAPYFGYMPGGMTEEEGWWNYTNPTIDELAQKFINGQFTTEKEYWDGNLRATELGLREAVRLYVCSMNQYVLANKTRFVDGSRMVYGLGDGVNNWSLVTANIKPTKVGGKDVRLLKVKLYSAKGSLFMNAWDPVNPQGFNDVYAQAIVSVVTDAASMITPTAADAEPWRASWKLADIKNQVAIEKGAIVGKIAVPAAALMYNSTTQKWVPAYNLKDPKDTKVAGKGLMAWSQATTSYYYGSWHNGQKVALADIMHGIAFAMDWTLEDKPGDLNYEAELASNSRPGIEDGNTSIVLNANGTFTTYFNYNWPLDFNYVAAAGTVGAGQIPWEIREACALLVTEGGVKNKNYKFSNAEGFTEVDLARKEIVADIKAKLLDMKARKYVPIYFKGMGWVTEAQAIARYDASVKFIDAYGHALVSNGPYFISKIEGESFVELRSIRELAGFDYPFTADSFVKRFAMDYTRVDLVSGTETASKTADLNLGIAVSKATFPQDQWSPAGKNVVVTVILVTPSGEKTYTGKYVKDGQYSALVPKADLAALPAGRYVIVVESKFGKEAPGIATTAIELK